MLDLTDDQGAMCGKIFADLGAEVIKIEPPGGCPTRRIPPFLDDQPGADRSLYFLSHQAGKLSVTANLDSAGGRAVVRDLAASADFIVESFPVGYLESIGLGYGALAESNPRLIYTAITPFGEDGPARDFKAADVVTWAAGGMMFLMGEPERPPLQMSLPQAGLHAGAEAAVASLLAHFPRQAEGRGQRIVVNMQACIVWTLMNEQAMPIMHGDYLRRQGVYLGSPKLRRKMVFKCRDGCVAMMITGGSVGAGSTSRLVKWMDEKGFAVDWMKQQDWSAWTPAVFMALGERDLRENAEMEQQVERFFATMTKHEIYAEGARRGVLLGPVMSAADTAADEQLAARNFFVDVDHPALGRTLRRPGAFAKFNRTPLEVSRPAPALGEHNELVYRKLPGYSADRIAELRAAGAISQRAAQKPMTRYALEGVHVLDFAWVGVGPITTKYLADNGADVIRIESAARIDVLRVSPPWPDGQPSSINSSQFFASYNTSKKSLTLDLSKPRARELALKLLPWAEIVTESFTPKVMRNWQLDYEHLRALKPDLVMLSTCLQGQTGPRAGFAGFGQLLSALSGFYHISGYSEDEICPPYGAYTDYVAPRFAACALLAALDYKRRTGVGQHIDLAQYEAGVQYLAPTLLDYFTTGRALGARGNRSDRYAPNGAYQCRDEDGNERWLALAVADDREWAALLAVLGAAPEQRFATMAQRFERRDELDRFIGGLVRDRVADDLTIALQAAGVAAYPVQSCLDLHRDENLRAFDFWHWLEHQEMGPAPYEGLQHRMSVTPGELRSPAPTLGQHNEEILGGMLGLSSDQIAELKREQVVY